MSMYNLIKAESKIMRNDTMWDLRKVNMWRVERGLNPVVCKGPSIRKLENAVALAIDVNGADITKMPELIRGYSFYLSILEEARKEAGI